MTITQASIKHRGGTAAQWIAANPVLNAREFGVETDTGKFKLGDGVTAWLSLPYFASLSVLDALYEPKMLDMPAWRNHYANRNLIPVPVVVLGDSISEGVVTTAPTYKKRWLDLVQKQLQLKDGATLSAGYMPSLYATEFIADDTVRGGSGYSEHSWGWGLGGKVTLLSGSGASTVTYPAQTCTRVRVWYGKTDFLGGTFRILFDDVDVTNTGKIYPGGTNSGNDIICYDSVKSDGFYWESAALSSASRVVKLLGVTGVGPLEGVEFLNGTSGVRVYDAAHSGAMASDYLRADMDWGHWTVVSRLAPKLVLINLGANDASSVSASTFQTNLAAVVNKIQAASSEATVVLYKGPKSTLHTPELWAQFNAAKDAVADAETDVYTFDFATPFGSTRSLFFEDALLHPNDQGNQRYADITAQLLTTG